MQYSPLAAATQNLSALPMNSYQQAQFPWRRCAQALATRREKGGYPQDERADCQKLGSPSGWLFFWFFGNVCVHFVDLKTILGVGVKLLEAVRGGPRHFAAAEAPENRPSTVYLTITTLFAVQLGGFTNQP